MVYRFLTMEYNITDKIHAMEISQAVFALNILNNWLEFSKCYFITLQISKTHFKNIILRPSDVIWFLEFLEQCFPSIPYIEHSWCFHTSYQSYLETVSHFLLGSLFASFRGGAGSHARPPWGCLESQKK